MSQMVKLSSESKRRMAGFLVLWFSNSIRTDEALALALEEMARSIRDSATRRNIAAAAAENPSL